MPGFLKWHGNGRPIITSYEDVFLYFEGDKRQPSLISAVSLHIFHLHIRDAIKQRESQTGQRMTRDETDEYIQKMIGSNELDNFKKYAEGVVYNEVSDIRSRKKWKKIIPLSGAWSGLLGNLLTLIAGFLLSVGVALYNDNNAVVSFLGFLNRCFAVTGKSI